MRIFLTSKHHRFGWLKARQSFHWLVLVVEGVPNLCLLYLLHPSYEVAHLSRKSETQTTAISKQAQEPYC